MSTVQSGSETLSQTPAGSSGADGDSPVFDPCSNDNPEFDKETQPCQGSIIDGDVIFEGAIMTTTTVPTLPKFEASNFNIEDESSATTTVAPDVAAADRTTVDPSFYSCSAASEDELMARNDNDTLLLRFNYEIYTPASIEDYTTALSTFEGRLANGVASSLGIDGDCPGLSIEVSVRSAGGRQLMPLRGMRRTIQKQNSVSDGRMMERTDFQSLVEGVSTDPADELNSETGKFSSMDGY